MLTREDKAEALRRFVPWDHKGAVPSDAELEERLIAARAADAEAAERYRRTLPEQMAARIDALEAEIAALKRQPLT